MKKSRKYREALERLEAGKVYPIDEAIDILKENGVKTKFDQTVELSCRLGVDPRKSDQIVRGTAILPHGTGKTVRVLCLVPEGKVPEATAAGADFAGLEEFVEKIQKGWLDFDVAVTMPENMKDVARLGKILGPRGLMPSPKNGTVTGDIAQTVAELKSGRVEFRVDKGANLHLALGKVSFQKDALVENLKATLEAINRSRPAAVKGKFIRKMTLSTTMGPGIPVQAAETA